jgi:hypothetical protein
MAEVESVAPVDNPTWSYSYWQRSVNADIARLREVPLDRATEYAEARAQLSLLEYFGALMLQGDINGYQRYIEFVNAEMTRSPKMDEEIPVPASEGPLYDPQTLETIIAAIQRDLDNRDTETLEAEALRIKERDVAKARAELMVFNGSTDTNSWVEFARDELNRIMASFPKPLSESFSNSFGQKGYLYPNVSPYSPYALGRLTDLGRGENINPRYLIEEIAPPEYTIATVQEARAAKNGRIKHLLENGELEKAIIERLTEPQEVTYRTKLYDIGQTLIKVLKGEETPETLQQIRDEDNHVQASWEYDILPAFAYQYSNPLLYQLLLGSEITESRKLLQAEATLLEHEKVVLELVSNTSFTSPGELETKRDSLEQATKRVDELSSRLSRQRLLMEQMTAGSPDAYATFIRELAGLLRSGYKGNSQLVKIPSPDHQMTEVQISDIVAEPDVDAIIDAVTAQLQSHPREE